MEVLVYENCLSILYLYMYVLGHNIKCISYRGLWSKPLKNHCPRMNGEPRATARGAYGKLLRLSKWEAMAMPLRTVCFRVKGDAYVLKGPVPQIYPINVSILTMDIPKAWRKVRSHHSLPPNSCMHRASSDKPYCAKPPFFAYSVPWLGFLFPAWLNAFFWTQLSYSVLWLCQYICTSYVYMCWLLCNYLLTCLSHLLDLKFLENRNQLY